MQDGDKPKPRKRRAPPWEVQKAKADAATRRARTDPAAFLRRYGHSGKTNARPVTLATTPWEDRPINEK